jgi:hypothetical protein
MALPVLTPISQTSAVILPQTGTATDVAGTLPYGIYSTSDSFLTGAADQVAYTYKMLGGDVLDIELTAGNVYAAYEDACVEYSYLVNLHQSKNSLTDLLGSATGSFDSDGTIIGGDASGSSAATKFTRFSFEYSRRVGDAIGTEVRVGGLVTIYSASIDVEVKKQDYDLEEILRNDPVHSGTVGTDNRIMVRKVYYKTPQAMWRFYGYYGGLNTVGNLASYGQYADDSTFEVIPVWQNKAQAMAFEDNIYTRTSGFSYQLRNNKLRIFPAPSIVQPKKMWIEYSVDESPLSSSVGYVQKQINGVNNMNTLPFENIPFENVNSIGKHWIRRYALAVSKGQLGEVRSKFATVPIPGESVTLNGTALKDESKTEKQALRDELKAIMDELTYTKLAQDDQAKITAVVETFKSIPMAIYTGPQGSS